MSQIFVEDTRVPVTFLKVGPCLVTQIKNKEKDGYWAVQLGFGEKKIRKLTKPLRGHLKGVIKHGTAPLILREVRLKEEPQVKVGDIIKVDDIFKKGDLVSVTAISKGKGFAGVVKRFGFAMGPRTHGQSDRLRAPGAIGQGTTPGRVWKGKKMAGRMGQERVTVKNLIIVDLDSQNNKIAVSGPVPGNKEGLVIIRKLASAKLAELVQETPEVVAQEELEVKDEKKTGEVKKKEEKEVVS